MVRREPDRRDERGDVQLLTLGCRLRRFDQLVEVDHGVTEVRADHTCRPEPMQREVTSRSSARLRPPGAAS